MMSHEPLITDADLQSYANGQLDPERRRAVEAYLLGDEPRAAEVEAFMRQNEAIRALFGSVADEPVPARLQPHRIARVLAMRRRRWLVTAAAASILFAGGIGLGWLASIVATPAENPGEALAYAALEAHQVFAAEGRHAVEVAAAEEDHLVSWLSNRVGEPLVAPDLASFGFTLIGGRLLPFDDAAAAQLMYEDADGGRLTLYITAGGAGAPEVDYAAAGTLHTYYWTSDVLSCAMVGELSPDELKTVATSAWRQLVAAI
ncbi:MAG: anti-sigma factor [Cucumibacter sp.]